MSSSNKNAYLKEMGIDVWVERNPISQNIEVNIPVVEKTEQKVSVATSSAEIKENPIPTATEVAINIETLDWQTLLTRVSECQLCELSKRRKQTFLGAGDQNADLMIVASAPTLEDEQQGHLFSGEAGKLLTAMLKAMGYQRNDVYLSNIVKCKTDENQEPSVEHKQSCTPYLLRQISLLKPKLILALGNAAAQQLLNSKSTMSRLRGQLHYVDTIKAPILVSYHPTYLLAAPNEKRKAWEDLQLAMKELQL